MLGAPSMFPDRMHVLAFIFLNSGGGYHWNKNGTPGCIYGMPEETNTMNLKDIKGLLADMNAKDKEYGASSSSGYRRAELELELLTLKHRTKNIDVYASASERGKKWRPETLFGASFGGLEGTLIGNLPNKVQKEWAFAADDLATAALVSLRDAKAAGSPYLNHDVLINRLGDALSTLEPITHRRANMAKVIRLLQYPEGSAGPTL